MNHDSTGQNKPSDIGGEFIFSAKPAFTAGKSESTHIRFPPCACESRLYSLLSDAIEIGREEYSVSLSRFGVKRRTQDS